MATKNSTSSAFDNPAFTDPEVARKHLESIRWPDGPVCPHCGGYTRIMALKGKATRPGVYKCGDCRKQFTVTVGTVFEGARIPLNKLVYATHLMCSSKKGISAHQLHRSLGVTYKTAWFIAHRIREAMREGGLSKPEKMGGSGSPVEADETYFGRRRSRKGEIMPSGYQQKEKVISLVERGGKVRSLHVPTVTAKSVRRVLVKQLHPEATLYTDAASYYRQAHKFVKKHESVNHTIEEYVRGDAHTQTIENYFSILKRGINGVYQHCSPKHLKRYLCEYDFRYNYRAKLGYSDTDRAEIALRGIVGKRLTYNPINA